MFLRYVKHPKLIPGHVLDDTGGTCDSVNCVVMEQHRYSIRGHCQIKLYNLTSFFMTLLIKLNVVELLNMVINNFFNHKLLNTVLATKQ